MISSWTWWYHENHYKSSDNSRTLFLGHHENHLNHPITLNFGCQVPKMTNTTLGKNVAQGIKLSW